MPSPASTTTSRVAAQNRTRLDERCCDDGALPVARRTSAGCGPVLVVRVRRRILSGVPKEILIRERGCLEKSGRKARGRRGLSENWSEAAQEGPGEDAAPCGHKRAARPTSRAPAFIGLASISSSTFFFFFSSCAGEGGSARQARYRLASTHAQRPAADLALRQSTPSLNPPSSAGGEP